VTITGAGTGATAKAEISGGAVIGIVVTAPGAGYGSGATVTISGDGSGATAVAAGTLPVIEERRLRVRCNCAVTFTRSGSSPFQENWTAGDITIPANSEVEWTGTWGSWRAGVIPLADTLVFPGDGSVTVRSSGELRLQSEDGQVRIGSAAESVGIVSAIGHGTPEGVLAAPAGSDYRNLDGGAGATFWIKQAGSGTTGWLAIA
jgi:hypothetical protein